MTSKLQNAMAWMRYATVLIVALAVAFVAIDQQDALVPIDERAAGVGGGLLDPYNDLERRIYTFGWPIIAGSRQITEGWLVTSDDSRIDEWKISWLALAIDVLVYLSIVCCTFVVARLYLPRIRTRRFSLALVFIFMTMSAVSAWWLMWEVDSFRRLKEPIATQNEAVDNENEMFSMSIMNESIVIAYGTYMPITYYAWWISGPVLYGMACVLFVVLRMLGAPLFRRNTRSHRGGH